MIQTKLLQEIRRLKDERDELVGHINSLEDDLKRTNQLLAQYETDYLVWKTRAEEALKLARSFAALVNVNGE